MHWEARQTWEGSITLTLKSVSLLTLKSSANLHASSYYRLANDVSEMEAMIVLCSHSHRPKLLVILLGCRWAHGPLQILHKLLKVD